MSAKRAINDKLQGSIAAYLRCGRLLITKLRKVFAECVSEFFLIGEYMASHKQERGCLMHFAHLATTLL